MPDLGLVQMLSIAQVLPTRSPIHRLDPRTRILGFGLILLAIVAAGRVFVALTGMVMVILLLAIARVPLRQFLRGLLLLLPWLLVVAAIQLVFGLGAVDACDPYLVLGPIVVTGCTIDLILVTLIRFVGLVLLVGLFAWTSPIPDLVRGIEALAAPLDRLGLPAHQVAMVGVIVVRFVPTLALELERLQKAQRARGAGLKKTRLGFLGRVRQTLPLLVPITVLALRRAERLAEAMEARAYGGGRGRGLYGRLSFSVWDWLALGTAIALFILMMFVI